jgi:hypothetical protein
MHGKVVCGFHEPWRSKSQVLNVVIVINRKTIG